MCDELSTRLPNSSVNRHRQSFMSWRTFSAARPALGQHAAIAHLTRDLPTGRAGIIPSTFIDVSVEVVQRLRLVLPLVGNYRERLSILSPRLAATFQRQHGKCDDGQGSRQQGSSSKSSVRKNQKWPHLYCHPTYRESPSRSGKREL
jgi:hypothetical protein